MARFSGGTYSAAVDESKRLIALAMLGITKYDFDKTTNKLTLYMQDGTVVEAALTADSSSGTAGEAVEGKCIAPWKAGETYQKDVSFVIYNGYIYFCSVTNNDATFTESHWTKLADNFDELSVEDVKAFLNLTPQEISKLSDIISKEIRLDKTFSSSDTYMRIQAAIDTAKEYTNNQLGKAVKPAYKVVSSTSEVTETGYFYLISNGTNFDMYVLSADGSVVSLGTSEVDLSNHYTKTETDNDFLKKSDATSTYATITTVDGKVDKTDIVDNLTATDTNKPLSANQGKVLKDEVDLKANDSDVVKKTDIVTTIDKTSTDDKIPTAKAIYNNPKNKIPELSKGTDIFAYADSIEEYVTITVKLMNGVNCPYGENANNSDFYYTIINMPSVNYKRIVAYDIRKNDMYMNIKHVTWGTWQRVCTTSVEDVPVTNITTNLVSTKVALDNSDSYATYYVKSGTCYVTIWSLRLIEACSVETIFNGLPKSTIGVTCPLCNGVESFAQVFMSPNSGVIAFNANASLVNKSGYCSFSYPVAES